MQNRRSYLMLAFSIGFVSLVYEIYSTRALFFFVPETSQAVTIAISAFLAGLAFSGLTFSSFAKSDNSYRTLRIIWWMQIASACYSILLLRNYGLIPTIIDNSVTHLTAAWFANLAKFTLLWLYLFVPAFFIGGSFPLINGLYLKSTVNITKDTGMVYFWDTCGAILGSLLTGFIFLPQLGFLLTATLAAILNLAIAFALRLIKIYKIIPLVAFLVIIIISRSDIISFAYSLDVVHQEQKGQEINLAGHSELDNRFGDILFQKNSAFGKITVGNNVNGIKDNRALFINYRIMCTSEEHSSEASLGSMVTSAMPEGQTVLNIGLGCGFTASTVADSSSVKHLDIAEINPVVTEASDKFFGQYNGNVIHSNKVNLHIEDGAQFLRQGLDSQYDSIVIDIEEPSVIYSSPLYTQEYFSIAKKRLKPGGVLSIWAGNGSPDFGKVLYNTLSSVFKYTALRLPGNKTYLVYFASDHDYNFSSVSDSDEQGLINKVLASRVTDINTIDNRSIEKYYNIDDFFGLPKDYTEPLIGK